MKYISRLILISATTITLFASLSLTLPVMANAAAAPIDARSEACTAIGGSSGGSVDGSCTPPAGSPSADSLLTSVINILSIVVGVASVIMIIIGGMRFVLSGGDSNNTNSARNTIIYAIVGLVVAALAQVLVHFVLQRVG